MKLGRGAKMGLAFGAAFGLVMLLHRPDRPANPEMATAAPASPAPAPSPAAGPGAVPSPSTVLLAAEDLAFLDALRAKFGPHRSDPHAQVKAIEQLIAYLMQRYPDDWRSRVRSFLDKLFPALADALFARFEGLERLNDWLAAHREDLLKMSPQERRAALWAARREAFGEDAEAIYAGEVRSDRLQDALQAIDVTQGLTADEKLAGYVKAIHEVYGDKAEDFIAARQTELMNSFLDVPSVQVELREMDAAQRSATLRSIRSGMGMDAEALSRWDELDRTRDQAWEAGRSYRAERQRIATQVVAAEQAQQLAALRERTFGAEAETIASEEQGGFFRFDHERRHGRE